MESIESERRGNGETCEVKRVEEKSPIAVVDGEVKDRTRANGGLQNEPGRRRDFNGGLNLDWSEEETQLPHRREEDMEALLSEFKISKASH